MDKGWTRVGIRVISNTRGTSVNFARRSAIVLSSSVRVRVRVRVRIRVRIRVEVEVEVEVEVCYECYE